MTATSPCEGAYWPQVICHLRQPSWLSDVGIPLAVTLGGLLIAFLLLRGQLRHDLELRNADRRAAVVNHFGVQALDVAESFWETVDADWWKQPKWPAWSSLYEYQNRARAALGDAEPFSELMSGYRDINHAWRACARRRIKLERSAFEFTDADHRLAMDSALNPLINDLHDAAERLVSWDGRGDIPEVRPWPHQHVPLGPRRGERHKRWMGYYADCYESELRQIAAKSKERRARQQRSS